MTPDKVLISRHGEHVQLHKTLIKHSIALRSSHTISGSLEWIICQQVVHKCEDSCAWFLKQNGLNALWKKSLTFQSTTSNVESFESTWQIEDFTCYHVLIPCNIPGHSKQSSTDVEQPKMFRNKQKLRSGNIGTDIESKCSVSKLVNWHMMF